MIFYIGYFSKPVLYNLVFKLAVIVLGLLEINSNLHL